MWSITYGGVQVVDRGNGQSGGSEMALSDEFWTYVIIRLGRRRPDALATWRTRRQMFPFDRLFKFFLLLFLLLFLYVLFSIYRYAVQVTSLIGILPLWQPSNITCSLCWLFYTLCWKIKYDDYDDTVVIILTKVWLQSTVISVYNVHISDCRTAYVIITYTNFTKFSVHGSCCHCSVFLWLQCNAFLALWISHVFT